MVSSDESMYSEAWDSSAGELSRSRDRRLDRLVWLAVLLVGWLVFELTADPAWTVLIGCLKFGWDELRAARRLKRLDPNAVRGRVVARFMVAYGFWKVSLVATGLLFVLPIIFVNMQGAKQAGPPREFFTALFIALVGFVVSGFVSLVAVVSAWRNRIPVWVGRRRNRVRDILLTVFLLWGTVGLLAIFLLVLPAIAFRNVAILMVVMFAVFFVAFPIGLMVMLDSVGRRIIAQSPRDCWPELLDPLDYSRYQSELAALLGLEPVMMEQGHAMRDEFGGTDNREEPR